MHLFLAQVLFSLVALDSYLVLHTLGLSLSHAAGSVMCETPS